MVSQTQPQHPNLPLPDYFSKFASTYVRQTGHSTLNILADIITNNVQTSAHPIGPESVVHDTAAGPGIGAAALVACLPKDQLPMKMLVSDNVSMMVSAAFESLAGSAARRRLQAARLAGPGVGTGQLLHPLDWQL